MMLMDREFRKGLDECLGRLSRGDDVRSCLEAYPKYADRLEPYLRAAVVAAASAERRDRRWAAAPGRRADLGPRPSAEGGYGCPGAVHVLDSCYRRVRRPRRRRRGERRAERAEPTAPYRRRGSHG